MVSNCEIAWAKNQLRQALGNKSFYGSCECGHIFDFLPPLKKGECECEFACPGCKQVQQYSFEEKWRKADNFRFADKSNRVDVLEYESQKENGCCGRIDIEVIYPPTNKVITNWSD